MTTSSSTQELLSSRDARARLRADLKVLVHDAEDLIKATGADVSEAAKAARARLQTGIEHTKEAYLEWQDESLETARAALARADTTVRAHPYESVGVAFGLGVLVGVLVRRR